MTTSPSIPPTTARGDSPPDHKGSDRDSSRSAGVVLHRDRRGQILLRTPSGDIIVITQVGNNRIGIRANDGYDAVLRENCPEDWLVEAASTGRKKGRA